MYSSTPPGSIEFDWLIVLRFMLYLPARSGRITISRRDSATHNAEMRRNVESLVQRPNLFPAIGSTQQQQAALSFVLCQCCRV